MPTKVSVGELLGTTLGALTRNLGPLIVLLLLVYLPFVAILALITTRADTEQGQMLTTFGSMIILMLAAFLAQGAVSSGMYNHLRGKGFGLGDSLARAVSQLLPLILLALVSTFLILAGFMLLLVPGLILQCALYVAVPAMMVEGLGVGAAVRRSFDLTAGYRMRIFGLNLLVGVVVGVPLRIVNMVIELAMAQSAPVAAFMITNLLSGLSSMAGAVAMVVVYFRLREDVDGVGLEQLADVFA
ncbi:MAG: hypothetical protein R3D98_04930 [Candidatus Krumholzibacteriia bacterium]